MFSRLANLIHLPLIGGAPDNPCAMPWQAYKLFLMIRDDPRQQRERMNCHLLLQEIAQLRVNDMLARNYFSHTTPDGKTVNEIIREAGYVLPDWYAEKGNSCESIGGNTLTAEDQFRGWLESPAHREHMFGEVEFYRNQTNIGLAYRYEDDMADVDILWSLITAP